MWGSSTPVSTLWGPLTFSWDANFLHTRDRILTPPNSIQYPYPYISPSTPLPVNVLIYAQPFIISYGSTFIPDIPWERLPGCHIHPISHIPTQRLPLFHRKLSLPQAFLKNLPIQVFRLYQPPGF